MKNDKFVLVFALAAGAVMSGCAETRVSTVRRFNVMRDRGDIEQAKAMVAPDALIWFENPTGEGAPWSPGLGAWAGWDEHFKSRKCLIGDYQRDGDWVVGLFHEDNEFYQLTEREWSRTMLGWRVGTDGRLSGMFVAGVGESADRFDEFVAWARANDPVEIEYLLPNGRIDPTVDRPQRFRAVLNTWRTSIGLQAIH